MWPVRFVEQALRSDASHATVEVPPGSGQSVSPASVFNEIGDRMADCT